MPQLSSSSDTPTAPGTAATPRDNRSARFVGYGLFGLILLLVWGLFLLSGAGDLKGNMTDLHIFRLTLNEDQVLLLSVLAAGALGGCIHVATSFSDYVGNGQYRASWEWWYLLRPFIGGSLATAFYFLMRGGVMSLAGGSTTQPSLHAVIAISFLVGMFSKQATDKLDDVFDTLFKTDKDAARDNGLESTVPVLTTLVPAAVDAGSGDTKVVLAGSSFAAGAQVRVNGKDRAADSVQPNAVEVTLKSDELAAPGRLKVAVLNASGALSSELEFEVRERRQVPGTPDDRGGTGAGTQQPAGQDAAGQGAAGQTPGGTDARQQTPAEPVQNAGGDAGGVQELAGVTSSGTAGQTPPAPNNEIEPG